MLSCDFAVVGAGIVGLATAHQLQARFPGRTVIVIEKEAGIARHQSSHNSGVLHSGIYYRPGSLRALNCGLGRSAMVDFCERERVPFEICGQVIVATEEAGLPRLQTIYERGIANGVRAELIGPERLREIEPYATGLGAIHVPEAGIVDFPGVCDALARSVTDAGGSILLEAELLNVRHTDAGVILETGAGDVGARFLVNCGGLQSDRVARAAGTPPPARIVPFRGEYYALAPESAPLCRNLIYPVPDPSFPFLGVHFTRMIGGVVECGPNAVLALAREGYTKTTIDLRDFFDAVSYPGFLRLAGRSLRAGAAEIARSFSKALFVRSLQRLVPSVSAEDLVPAPAGVRAQAISPDGKLIDDFLIVEGERVVSICNAPSPAATSSLRIGELIADRVAARVGGATHGTVCPPARPTAVDPTISRMDVGRVGHSRRNLRYDPSPGCRLPVPRSSPRH